MRTEAKKREVANMSYSVSVCMTIFPWVCFLYSMFETAHTVSAYVCRPASACLYVCIYVDMSMGLYTVLLHLKLRLDLNLK